MYQQVKYTPSYKGPLSGLRVIDLSRLVAGNFLSVQLADFGAEVIKIEDPVKGDLLRQWGGQVPGAYWKLYGRNKKSVCLNIKEEKGRNILLKLLENADLMIENFRPGYLESLGLAPDTLLEANGRLVVVRVSGWGQTGPYRSRPAFGTLIESMSGYVARTGYKGKEPLLPPTALADMIAGLYGASAALVALRHRDLVSGEGQIIDLSLLEPMFSLIAGDAITFRFTGDIPQANGSRSTTAAPRNVFLTKDQKWLAISASTQSMAERLFGAIDRSDMIHDPRFRNNSARLQHVEACEAPITSFIRARTLQENLEVFGKAEVTVAAVYNIEDFMNDPHVVERGIVIECHDDELGKIPMYNVTPRLSHTPGSIARPAPRLGEHTEEILGELGISMKLMDELARDGIILSGVAHSKAV